MRVHHRFDDAVLDQGGRYLTGAAHHPLLLKGVQRGDVLRPCHRHPGSEFSCVFLHAPCFVAVIMNRPRQDWESIFRSHDIQCVSVAIYRNSDGTRAHELVGDLPAMKEIVAWGRYLASDHSFLFPSGGANSLHLFRPRACQSYRDVEKGLTQ